MIQEEILPVNKELSIEWHEGHLLKLRSDCKMRIIPHISRRPPYGDCYVLWLQYICYSSSGDALKVRGYVCSFGIHDRLDWTREWKTLKGIKNFIEKNYGEIVL